MKHRLISFFIAFSIVASPSLSFAVNKKSNKHFSRSSGQSHNGMHTRISNLSKNKKLAGKYRVSIRKPVGRVVKQSFYAQRGEHILNDLYDGSGPLQLSSSKALVINQLTGETLYAKNTSIPTPIASVTKLMTAMVVLDARLPMDDIIFIGDDDLDYLKGTHSRLTVGAALTRAELLQLALMSSENRAASALGRNYPGGLHAFITAMNHKAQQLGMKDTNFVDSTGLDSGNMSTAEDLAKMVNAAYQYAEIRQITTTPAQEVMLYGRSNALNFVNTNALVRNGNWVIGLSKTGFINEAGRCLVMQAEISGQPMIIVLLDSMGKMTRIGDANRIRKWVEFNHIETSNNIENVNG